MDAAENAEIHEEVDWLHMLWRIARPSAHGRPVNWIELREVVGQLNQSEDVGSAPFVGRIKEAADALESGIGDVLALRDRINEYESHRTKEWYKPPIPYLYGFPCHDPRFGPYG